MIASSVAVDVENAVKTRYSGAARSPEASLCCPTTYDPKLLEAIPSEVLERDYGCGNPSEHLKPGETVLDLGSGSGKICFLASQGVGAEGRVIGVDMNDDMLALARRCASEVARRIGYGNVAFKKARIQDLGLDLDELDRYLRANPVRSADDAARLDAEVARLRRERPLIASDSVDDVVSNCVLNLVRRRARRIEPRRGGDRPHRRCARPSGYREYPPDAVRVIRFIKRAQDLGFTLNEIAELLRLRSSQAAPCSEVRAAAEAKIEDIDRRIRSLRAMKRALGILVSSCRTDGSARQCPILEALDHGGQKERQP